VALAPILPEVETLTLRPLLIPLLEVVGFGVALGLIYVNDYLIRALFGAAEGLVSWVPWIGRRAANGLHAVEKRLVHAMGAAEHSLEPKIGAAFTQLGNTITAVVDEIVALSILADRLEWYVFVRFPVHTLFPLVQRLEHAGRVTITKHTTVINRVRVIEKTIAYPSTGKLGATIKKSLKPVAAGLALSVALILPRLRALEHAIAVEIPHGLAGARARERALTDRLAGLGRRVKSLERGTAVVIGAAVLTAALAKIGAGWIRCTNVRKAGRNVCGMNTSLLDSLLLDTIAIAGLLSIEEFARTLVSIEDDVVPIILKGFRETRDIA